MKIYLASPYSHPSKVMRQARFEAAVRAAGRLMQQYHIVFSPIVHSHYISEAILNPVDHDFWMRQDRAFVEWCDEVRVLKLPGWIESVGVNMEVAWALELGKPVEYMEAV